MRSAWHGALIPHSAKGDALQVSLLTREAFRVRATSKVVRFWVIASFIVCSLILADGVYAVPIEQERTPPVQAFVSRGDQDDTVSFVDVLTGAVTSVTVNGENYTIAGDNVLFRDLANNQIALISPDGIVSPHPFIQAGDAARRVDWAVSNDNRLIAWTLTETNGDQLTTVTTVANMDGTNPQQVLVDGPRVGVRALPVAFSVDDNYLYMDYQPDGFGALTPFNEYAGLFEVSLKEGFAVSSLPGEPGCYCGAGFGGGYFVRLIVPAEGTDGFDVRVYDITAQVETNIDGLRRFPAFTQGGDVLVSPDGTRAIYAVSQTRDFGSPGQVVQSVFVLVDLEAGITRQLTQPQTLYIRPVAWTEGNNAVIFTSPNREGTWKMSMETGLLEQIASAGYIGTITHAG